MNKNPLPARSSTPWGAIFSLFVGLLYGVSPIDIIPDLIPLLGFLDDAAVVPIMLLLALFQYMRAKKRSAPAAADQVIVVPGQKA